MKKMFALLLIILIFPLISAININVEKIDSNEVIVAGINKPATFDLKITNYGEDDIIRFDNFLGFSMFPVGTIPMKKGETKSVELEIYPNENFEQRGFYNFQYFITSEDTTRISEKLIIKIINLEDVFEIGSGDVDPSTNSMEIYMHNKENFDFENLDVEFSSAFFDFEESFALGPNERKNFNIQLDKKDFNKLMAGFYTLNAEILSGDVSAKIEGTIRFVEKDIVTTSQTDYGLIVQTEIIEKTNEGNVLTTSETTIRKNIISRLFTTFNPEPDIVDRHGFQVDYTWNSEIKPGESIEITIKTNWFFPLIIIFFIVAIVILAKQYSKTDLLLRKKVSFVKAKGGEFALKVSLIVNAKKYVERIKVMDKLPPLMKIYERYGGETPSRVDEKNRRIEWDFEKLEAGEIRVLSYVIYSKIGVLGKFALPSATAVYEYNGEIHESESNRAFFVSEQRGKEEIEE